MRHHQRGVTFLGWLFLLAPMALLLYAVIRLTPVYLEYTKISRTLEQVAKEFQGEPVDAGSLRTAVQRRFDVESVNVMSTQDTDKLKIARDGDGYTIQAVYAQSVPFVSNISLQASFDKTVKID